MTANNVRATVAATAVTLLACGAAQAAEWVSIGKSVDGKTEEFADVSDIKIVGNVRRVWLKIVDAPHKTKRGATRSTKSTAYTVTRYAFRCDVETSMQEAGIIYYEDGTNLTIPSYSMSASWDPVAPETMLHIAMDFTCAWKPTTQTGDPPSQNGEPHLSDVDRSTPAQGVVTIRLPDCHKDYYPSQALRLKQQGAVVVKFCIGVNNKIDGPVEVVTSSGFPLLDEAAGKCVGAGSYKAGVINGAPARTCKALRVQFAPP